MNVAEAWEQTVLMLARRGFTNMANHNGVINCDVDENWTIIFNPHKNPVSDGSVEHGPYEVHIEYNGTPVGIINPAGGMIIADCNGSAEDDFIAALKAA